MNTLLEIGPYLLLTGGIGVCLTVFVSLKREIFSLSRRLSEQQGELLNLEQRIASQTDEIRISLKEAEERSGLLVPPSPLRSGFNLSKRSQVIRMSRHGETPENIATALSLPRSEVDLLIKVQRIVLTSAEIPTTF